MNTDPAVASIAITAAVQAVSLLRDYLPDVSEMVKADPAAHPHFAEAVRAGEISALTGVGIIAVTAYAVTGDTAPLLAGLAAAAGMVALYEVLLRRQSTANPPAVTVAGTPLGDQ